MAGMSSRVESGAKSAAINGKLDALSSTRVVLDLVLSADLWLSAECLSSVARIESSRMSVGGPMVTSSDRPGTRRFKRKSWT